MGLTLRRATLDDSERLFLWRNEKSCIENSFSNSKVEYSSHYKWLESKLLDESVEIYILQCDEVLIGQIRVEFDNTVGLLSYSIDIENRGKGYGREIIRLLEEKYIIEGKRCSLIGYVKKENNTSCKVFEKLNYKKVELEHMYKYCKEI